MLKILGVPSVVTKKLREIGMGHGKFPGFPVQSLPILAQVISLDTQNKIVMRIYE